jgi:hypothetical protein
MYLATDLTEEAVAGIVGNTFFVRIGGAEELIQVIGPIRAAGKAT